jgi:hypothetical protein
VPSCFSHESVAALPDGAPAPRSRVPRAKSPGEGRKRIARHGRSCVPGVDCPLRRQRRRCRTG